MLYDSGVLNGKRVENPCVAPFAYLFTRLFCVACLGRANGKLWFKRAHRAAALVAFDKYIPRFDKIPGRSKVRYCYFKMAVFWIRSHTFFVSTTTLLINECKTIRNK